MDGTLTFQDIFDNSVLEAGGFLQNISMQTVIDAAIYVLLSLLMGIALYFIYKKSFTGVVYSQSFAISIAGMTVLTCCIIVTIQSNIVLSLGMVGALSIVRYRTAVKDPMDLLFLFWAVAAGIAIGAGMFYIALLTSVFMVLLLWILSGRKHGRDEMYILLLHYEGEGIDEEVRKILGTNPYQIKSKTMRKNDTEMAVEVRVRKHDLSFTDRIRKIENIKDLTIVQYRGDYVD